MEGLAPIYTNRSTPGYILMIPLDNGQMCFGQVLEDRSLVVFNKIWNALPGTLVEAISHPILVHVNVEPAMGRKWPYVGKAPIPLELTAPRYWKPNSQSKDLIDLIVGGNIVRGVPRSDGIGLPRHGIWTVDAVEERLKHLFYGTKDPWDECLGPFNWVLS